MQKAFLPKVQGYLFHVFAGGGKKALHLHAGSATEAGIAMPVQFLAFGKLRSTVSLDIRADRMQQNALGRGGGSHTKRKETGLTFDDAWAIFDEKWLPNLKRADMERRFYTTYLKPAIGNKPLHMITPLELEDLKNSLLKKGLAPASVKLIVGNVRRVVEWDLYSGPKPMEKVKLPKVDNARDRFLTADAAQTLLAAVKKRSQLWHDVSLISLNTSMRLSEILGLRPQDVDLKNRIMHLTAKQAGAPFR